MRFGIPAVRRLTCALLALAAMQMLMVQSAAASWWNGDWQYRVKIDADAGTKGANIAEPIGRTQVLVRLLANNFKFDTAKPDGSDIRFVAADDRTPLHYHIEKWDGLIDQVALVWVDVPDLAPSAATSITMYWGNAHANDASDAKATYDSDQLLVWHFGEENGLAHDSTAYGNNALTAGKRDDSGIIGYAQKYDGSAPVKIAPNPTLNLAAGSAATWQMWIKPVSPTQTSALYDQRDAGGVNDALIGLQAGAPFVAVSTAAGTARAQAPSPLVADSWHLLSVTAGADHITLFVDGAKAAEAAGALPAIAGAATLGGVAGNAPAPAGASSAPAAPGASSAPAAPGAGAPAAAAPALANFAGQIDELQISRVARPAGAIMVADRSQGPQSNLFSFENPEQTSSFGSGYLGIILRSVTLDAWVIIGILGIMMLISWLVMVLKGITVSTTAGANKRFRALLRETARQPTNDLLPQLPRDRTQRLAGSCLYRVYETGVREVNDRLAGGRTLVDGQIAPQSLAAIRSAMDAQMIRETQRLNNQMVFLTIAISGGPFVGLLGTVVGVMITFAAIAAQGDVNVNSIAPGISAALLATAAGMFVAIPALFGYNYYQTRIKSAVTEMAVFVDEIVTRIAEGDLGRRTRPAAAE